MNKYIFYENNYVYITYNNKKLKILKYMSESCEQFDSRLKFIKLLEKNNIIYKNVELLSLYWYNINKYGCIYDTKTTNFINNLN